jgi:hypothetical protein
MFVGELRRAPRLTVTLEEVEGGTLLTLVHSNVPEGQTSYEQGGGRSTISNR